MLDFLDDFVCNNFSVLIDSVNDRLTISSNIKESDIIYFLHIYRISLKFNRLNFEDKGESI